MQLLTPGSERIPDYQALVQHLARKLQNESPDGGRLLENVVQVAENPYC